MAPLITLSKMILSKERKGRTPASSPGTRRVAWYCRAGLLLGLEREWREAITLACSQRSLVELKYQRDVVCD